MDFKERYELIYLMAKLKNEGMEYKSYFEKNNYTSVALYGMSHICELYIDYLRDEKADVKCVIDRNPDNVFFDIDTFTPEEFDEIVDIIIVCAGDYNMIKDRYFANYEGEITSIEDVMRWYVLNEG